MRQLYFQITKNISKMNLEIRQQIDNQFYKQLRIDFDFKHIGDEGMKHISTKYTQKIEFLRVSYCDISSKGIRFISKNDWDSLTFIYLSDNNIGNKGCQYLTRMFCPQLSSLSLGNDNIDDIGALHLSKATWKCLSSLELCSGDLSKNGVFNLTKANWKRMRHPYLYDSQINFEGAKQFIMYESQNIKKITMKSKKQMYIELALSLQTWFIQKFNCQSQQIRL